MRSLANMMARTALLLGLLASFLCSTAASAQVGLGLGVQQVASRGRSAAHVFGLMPTTAAAMGLTPTVQYHIPSATMTLRPDGQFQGYISGSHPTLTVSGWTNASSLTLREGVVISSGAAAGTTILKSDSNGPGGAGNSGLGGNGNYFVDVVQTVGSSGAPVTMTSKSNELATLNDVTNNSNLTLSIADPAGGSFPGGGPQVLTDGYGRKFLRFAGTAAVNAFLRNLTLSGLDSANMSWFIVGMVQNLNNVGQIPGGSGNATILQTGTQEAATGNVNAGAALMINQGMPVINGYTIQTTLSSAPNLNKMYLGEQMQVYGTVQATTDGVNGGASVTSTAANRTFLSVVNEQQVAYTTSPTGTNRVINQTGFTLGRPSIAGGSRATIDVYEIDGFLTGQMGTVMSAVPVKASQVVSGMMTNWNLVPFTKSLILMGDSRTVYGEGGNAGLSSDGSGYSIASLLGEQGQPYSLPSNVRILEYAQPGEGIAKAHAVIDYNANYAANGATALLGSMMFGGGNDYVAFVMGVNEAGGGEWPTTSAGGGTNAPNSVALGNELYNGAGYQITADVTNAANAVSGTFANTVGTMFAGARVTSGGYGPGLAVTSVSGSTINVNRYEPTAHSAVSTTFRFDGYLPFVQKLLSRGFKVLAYAEPRQIGTADARQTLATHLLNDLPTDVAGMGILLTGDASTIMASGVAPFGLNYQGASVPGASFVDIVHLTRAGKLNIVGGGSTPNNGYAARIKALLAN